LVGSSVYSTVNDGARILDLYIADIYVIGKSWEFVETCMNSLVLVWSYSHNLFAELFSSSKVTR